MPYLLKQLLLNFSKSSFTFVSIISSPFKIIHLFFHNFHKSLFLPWLHYMNINVISTIMLMLINHNLPLKLMREHWKWHFRASRFQNFLGEHSPRPSGALQSLNCHNPLLFQSWSPTSNPGARSLAGYGDPAQGLK